MKLQKITARNYKTYKELDLDLTTAPQRPIILIGGANGCGKTTLFDAIYHALYGLQIKGGKDFDRLFNAGVKVAEGITNKRIELEIQFSGMVMGVEQNYRLKRSYFLLDDTVRENVVFNMAGNTYNYGTHTPARERAVSEAIVNKIISANLPKDLSNYFLFDAMKTSDLVREEQINKLIMNNINTVMGFNKFSRLQKAAAELLAERRAAMIENENQRKEYSELNSKKQTCEKELSQMEDEYSIALNYANENKEQYEQLKAGHNADDITRDKIKQIEDSITAFKRSENEFVKDSSSLARDIETRVIYPKLASMIKTEVDVIVNDKRHVMEQKGKILSDSQIEKITRDVVQLIEQRYIKAGTVDVKLIGDELKEIQKNEILLDDKFPYLTDSEVKLLERLVANAMSNPFTSLADRRDRLNLDAEEIPQRKQQLHDYRTTLNSTDYSLLDIYNRNNARIAELKEEISKKKEDIKSLETKIAGYDIEIQPEPDPEYEMLCRLPEFFESLASKLLRAKRTRIENLMREQLNTNLVVYAGVIGRVELSNGNGDDVNFKIYHRNGNEIYLSQLNAGAKQTVMQVLLKVLYSLGDYDPPVMIDTVMGVLDKESREMIMEHYFPDLAQQTILLSTDTEITTEHDFEKIQAYVARTYTLHRDKENQCTTVTEDYFGLKTESDE